MDAALRGSSRPRARSVAPGSSRRQAPTEVSGPLSRVPRAPRVPRPETSGSERKTPPTIRTRPQASPSGAPSAGSIRRAPPERLSATLPWLSSAPDRPAALPSQPAEHPPRSIDPWKHPHASFGADRVGVWPQRNARSGVYKQPAARPRNRDYCFRPIAGTGFSRPPARETSKSRSLRGANGGAGGLLDRSMRCARGNIRERGKSSEVIG